MLKKKIEIIEYITFKYYKKIFLVKINKIEDRNKANILKNKKIFIHKSSLPKLKNLDFYWRDIIGCKVINLEKHTFGIVDSILENKIHDTLVINPNYQLKIKKIFIPFINIKIIKKVDLNNKIIIVNWKKF